MSETLASLDTIYYRSDRFDILDGEAGLELQFAHLIYGAAGRAHSGNLLILVRGGLSLNRQSRESGNLVFLWRGPRFRGDDELPTSVP